MAHGIDNTRNPFHSREVLRNKKSPPSNATARTALAASRSLSPELRESPTIESREGSPDPEANRYPEDSLFLPLETRSNAGSTASGIQEEEEEEEDDLRQTPAERGEKARRNAIARQKHSTPPVVEEPPIDRTDQSLAALTQRLVFGTRLGTISPLQRLQQVLPGTRKFSPDTLEPIP